MKNTKNEFKCIGCGLCQSELGQECSFNGKGFCTVKLSDAKAAAIVDEICPVVGNMDSSVFPWGKIINSYSGYSTDATIRRRASSGGVLTALAIYLLESGQVDGVIQTIASERQPYATESVVSYSKEDVLKCCGSRYSISAPWSGLKDIINPEKKYAVIAKPCDIAVLKTYSHNYSRYENIKFYLSFFCAGLPSNEAQKQLIRESGCSEDKCARINYRGNGWPGETTITDFDENKYTMKYERSWGKILGRDVNDFCRVCADGIGCFADVACGDGWYISNNQPDFSEHEGRNVVFTRNDIGQKLIEDASAAGYISIEPWENIDDLKIIQKYQFTRRTTMKSRLCAYRLFGKNAPRYNKKTMKGLACYISTKEKARVFWGTVKRIVKGRIK